MHRLWKPVSSSVVGAIVGVVLACSPKAPEAVPANAAPPALPLAAPRPMPEAQHVSQHETVAEPDRAPAAAPATSPPIELPPAKLLHVLRHAGEVSSLVFDPTGDSFASGCSDHRVRLWSAPKGRLARTFTDHGEAVSSVAFRFDGLELLSGSLDGTAKSWNPKTGRRVATTAGPGGGVASVAYSPDGRRLALGGADGRIVIVDAADEAARFDLGAPAGAVRALAWARKHDWLLSRTDDGVLALWDVSQRTTIHRITVTKDAASSVTFAEDDDLLATTWEPESRAAIGMWSARTANHADDLLVEGPAARSLSLSDDGRLLAVGTSEGVVQIWDFKARRKLREMKQFAKNVNAVAFGAGWKYLAAGGDDKIVAVWQLYSEPVEKPGRAACLERCRRRAMNTDCADESGGLVACPCRCP